MDPLESEVVKIQYKTMYITKINLKIYKMLLYLLYDNYPHFHILYFLRFIFIIYIVLYCILTTSDSSGSDRDSSNLSI
jgi:hypothetical protein